MNSRIRTLDSLHIRSRPKSRSLLSSFLITLSLISVLGCGSTRKISKEVPKVYVKANRCVTNKEELSQDISNLVSIELSPAVLAEKDSTAEITRTVELGKEVYVPSICEDVGPLCRSADSLYSTLTYEDVDLLSQDFISLREDSLMQQKRRKIESDYQLSYKFKVEAINDSTYYLGPYNLHINDSISRVSNIGFGEQDTYNEDLGLHLEQIMEIDHIDGLGQGYHASFQDISGSASIVIHKKRWSCPDEIYLSRLDKYFGDAGIPMEQYIDEYLQEQNFLIDYAKKNLDALITTVEDLGCETQKYTEDILFADDLLEHREEELTDLELTPRKKDCDEEEEEQENCIRVIGNGIIELDPSCTESMRYQVYSIDSRFLGNDKISPGEQYNICDIYGLGTYVAHFISKDGNIETEKIVCN